MLNYSKIYSLDESLKGTVTRQALELQAQRRTLEEQRTHIAMLETALSNAQDRLTRKEKASAKQEPRVQMRFFQMCEEHAGRSEGTAYLEKLLHDAIVDKQARKFCN